MSELKMTLNDQELKRVLKVMLSGSSLSSLGELGKELGFKETTFRSAITNNSMRYRDFIQAAEAMGYDVIIQKKTN